MQYQSFRGGDSTDIPDPNKNVGKAQKAPFDTLVCAGTSCAGGTQGICPAAASRSLRQLQPRRLVDSLHAKGKRRVWQPLRDRVHAADLKQGAGGTAGGHGSKRRQGTQTQVYMPGGTQPRKASCGPLASFSSALIATAATGKMSCRAGAEQAAHDSAEPRISRLFGRSACQPASISQEQPFQSAPAAAGAQGRSGKAGTTHHLERHAARHHPGQAVSHPGALVDAQHARHALHTWGGGRGKGRARMAQQQAMALKHIRACGVATRCLLLPGGPTSWNSCKGARRGERGGPKMRHSTQQTLHAASQ